ncbi:MAG TPA: hypothetical protein VF245_08820 [Solirubrobacterales bacterium]
MKAAATTAIVSLALLALQASSAQGAATTVGFWAGEAVPGTNWGDPGTYWNRRDTHSYTPYLWQVLADNRIPLYFNLRYKRDFGPVPPGEPHRHDALPILREANRLGVPVWGWVLVPFSDGYWASEGNAAEQFRAVKSLVGWARREGVVLQGLALDPEPPVGTPQEASAALLGGAGEAALPTLLGRPTNPAGQCAAWVAYENIGRWAANHGIALSAAPMPTALDDLEDGRLALEDASDFVLPRGHWYQLFFQAYRSVFAYHAGVDPGPGIVTSYLRSARRQFWDTGQVSLGSAGRGPYRRFRTLLHDVRLAATLHAREVPIYSLERTLRSYGGPRALIRLVQAGRHPFTGKLARAATTPTPEADAIRATIRANDAALAGSMPELTAKAGVGAQEANPWPGGCGAGWTVNY